MASPDVTDYVDLILRTMDPQDIVVAALQEMQLTIPEWVPRESNIEMVLLEGMAVQIAELIYSANQIPSGVVQAFLKLMGVEHDDGAPPTTSIRFHLSSATTVTFPEDTTVILELSNGEDPIIFRTDNEVTTDGIVTVIDIPATGDRNTSVANGIVAGTDLEVIDALTFVEYAEVATDIVDGRDSETDDNYFIRGAQRFQRLTSVLVTPDQFVAFLVEDAAIYRAFAIDQYNAAGDGGGDGPYGSDPGYITLAVYGEAGAISAPVKTDLLNQILAMVPSHLSVQIIDPTINNQNFNVTVLRDLAFAAADVQANIATALQARYSPQTWEWGRTLYRNDIITTIGNVPGVELVQTLTTPASDVTLTGAAPLLNVGTVTITVAN